MLAGQEIAEITDFFREHKEQEVEAMVMESLLQNLLPNIFIQLILKDKIDKTKINDRDYLLSKVLDRSEIRNDIFYVVAFHKNFIEAAREAIEANRSEVAIVLISTVVEHIINIEYRHLMRYREFSDKDITKIIKRNSFEDKLGWLMSLIFEMDLEEDLKRKISKIIEARNAIVHYKALPVNMADEDTKSGYDNIQQQIEDIDFDILAIPESLEKIMVAQKFKLYPDLLLVKEMMETFFQDEFEL